MRAQQRKHVTSGWGGEREPGLAHAAPVASPAASHLAFPSSGELDPWPPLLPRHSRSV